ncbi:unnamed protein product [Schistosoma margrebowiei]|uniref:Uncharacterized protein n=1 Tax=Schistosoma margrebowiei TaxID=48269 RepID=A0A183MUZ9_9TREM|nr:unnamed protein product [Schistosoma margrebowiei]
MVVGGSRQETLNPGFVLLGTHQQGVPVILRELVLQDFEGGIDTDLNFIPHLRLQAHVADGYQLTRILNLRCPGN